MRPSAFPLRHPLLLLLAGALACSDAPSVPAEEPEAAITAPDAIAAPTPDPTPRPLVLTITHISLPPSASPDARGMWTLLHERASLFADVLVSEQARNPKLKGNIALGFTVVAGKVSDVHLVADSTADPAFCAAFAAVLGTMVLDPEVNVVVTAAWWRAG